MKTAPNPDCLLIAEIGNCHEGSVPAALEMMDAAKDAGADLIKFQAGMADGFARNPTDPEEIRKYRKYELGREGYDLLLKHGLEIGVPVFFSVWSPEFEVYNGLSWRKIAARQCKPETILKYDSKSTFISIPHTMPLKVAAQLPIRHGIPMHTCAEYPSYTGRLTRMNDLRAAMRRKVGEIGYSDHTIGIYWPVKMALDRYVRARAVEKHFTLAHDYGPLRDHRLAATPKEFKEMAMMIKFWGVLS